MLGRQQREPRRLVIIAYDTPSDRRRRHMARLLDAHGERVQKSVFEAHLTATQMAWMTRRLEALIDPAEDKVHVVSACARCQAEIVLLGQQAPADVPSYFIA